MKLIELLKSRLVEWVWNHSPNCAEMSRLASKSFEAPISLTTRMAMRLHFLICVWCKRYAQQLQIIHKCSPHLGNHLDATSTRPLSTESKERMKRSLREFKG